jgi:Co/Zn/Cd efflux system component
MANCCGGACTPEKAPRDPRYRRILWIALVLNGAMFGVELIGGWHAGSAALLADAVDFFGDATNYGLSLFVLAMTPVWRPRSALIKGASMGLYGVFVLATTLWHWWAGTLPVAPTMGVIGVAALLTNGVVAALLYAYRNGDSDMRAVWLCTRNDVIGNLAVLLAALGVAGSGGNWPDLLVALVMGTLGLTAARAVIAAARRELHAGATELRRI